MRAITADEIDRVLSFPNLVEALRQAFAAPAAVPLRHHHAIGEGQAVHLLMPAWSAEAPAPGSFLGTKIVNVFPENGRRGLPSVSATYVLMSGETGIPLVVLDGTRLTLWRTAAASALAASYLARKDAARLVMVGAGALAPFLIRAHQSQRLITDIAVWNHNASRAAALAERLRQEGCAARLAGNLEAAVREADIISCATLSKSPLVKGEWLRRGAHLDLVGAFDLTMREADDEALLRSSVFVDTKAALEEGGDVTLALKAGAIDSAHVRGDLSDLCAGRHAGRGSADEITLFKSVGTAIEDLAGAMLVWRRIKKR